MNPLGTSIKLLVTAAVPLAVFGWWTQDLTPSAMVSILIPGAVMALIRLPGGRARSR